MTAAMPERFESLTIRTKTPDGTLFTIVDEVEGKPFAVRLEIGKAGSALKAWTSAFGAVVSLALRNGISLEDILTEISNITSDRFVYDTNSTPIRSGPDGFAFSMQKYRGHKYKEMNKYLGQEERRRRPPKLHGRSAS